MLVVGLDLGTQSCKAVVCDERLTVLGAHAIAYETSYPQPGHAEQDPAAWEAAIAPAIAGALEEARVGPGDVGALSVSGQLDGCVAVGDDGGALHPALIWQDRRAIAEAARVDAAQLFARTGQVADAGHMAPKAAWLRARLGRGIARYHQPTTYLVERLTGEAAIDPALASTTMLFDLAARAWAPELLAAWQLDARELPRIADAASLAGAITEAGARRSGLRAGTRVAVGTGDDFATPLGAGLVAPDGRAICALGTAEVVGALAAAPTLDRASDEPMVETHAYVGDGYFIENPGWLSGGTLRWVRKLLGIDSDAELDAIAAAAPPGAGGVTFVPALAGAMTPRWRPHARGAFYGLAPGHDRTHIARAVLEGLAFACRDVVERLAALGLPRERVLLLGGGSRSRVWAQLRADALGLPHDRAANADTCPVGAALLAAIAIGVHADLASAAAALPPPAETFHPATSLDDAYARYRRLGTALAPLGDAAWEVR